MNGSAKRVGGRPLNLVVRQPVKTALRTTAAALSMLWWCLANAGGPTADELYSRLKTARVAISESGPPGVLELYSRKWLVDGISGAFEAGQLPHSQVDHTKVSLWAHFTGIGIISAVYSYRLVPADATFPALEVRLTTNLCGLPGEDRPAVDTFIFAKEEGVWRVTAERISTAGKDLSWYSPKLTPVHRFPYFEPLDRTAVSNEFLASMGSSKRVSSQCSREPR